MGYRSQVAGIISVDRVLVKPESGSSYYKYDKAKFKEMIGFIKLTKFYELWTESDNDSFGWKDGAFIMHGNDWKWYPDYPDVMAWDEMWKNMQTIEGISGYFCRVGEESDDIVHMEFGDDPCTDYFHAFTALSFEGDDYLGKRDTDEAETTQENTATPQPDCAGANHATETQQRKA
jgi:hypothetical protein